jgi:hypothetical protein
MQSHFIEQTVPLRGGMMECKNSIVVVHISATTLTLVRRQHRDFTTSARKEQVGNISRPDWQPRKARHSNGAHLPGRQPHDFSPTTIYHPNNNQRQSKILRPNGLPDREPLCNNKLTTAQHSSVRSVSEFTGQDWNRVPDRPHHVPIVRSTFGIATLVVRQL